MHTFKRRIIKILTWILRLLVITSILCFTVSLLTNYEHRLPVMKISDDREMDSFASLTAVADEYIREYANETYELCHMELEYNKDFHACSTVQFEYYSAKQHLSCRISLHTKDREMVGKLCTNSAYKKKLDVANWTIRMTDIIEKSLVEWTRFTLSATHSAVQRENDYDYVYVKYFIDDKETMCIGFDATMPPPWLQENYKKEVA